MNDSRQERPARLPSWAASCVAHGVLLVAVVWLLRPAPPEGASDAPLREVGIVLRQTPRENAMLQEIAPLENEAPPTERAETADLSPALLEATTSSPFAALLEEATAEGPAVGEPSESTGDGPSGGRPNLPIGQARVAVFGVEGVGSRFVYAFDRSISMRGAPLGAAKRQLVESLTSLESTHQFQILFFNHRVSAFDLTGGQRRIAFGTDENKRLAEDFVSGVTADGNTDRFGALSHALKLRPDVVFFLTDADSPMSPVELQRIATANERYGATICTIEFGVGPQRRERNFLMDLADQTGGQHGYVDISRLSR